MASCKDCIHFESCKNLYETHGEGLSGDSYVCDFFKDQSRFVELPCKVGDKVYLDNLHIKYADVIGIYIDAFGGVLDLRAFTNVPIPNGFGYEHFISKDYTFEDIGKRIFLTREEAEQALKEREENA